MRDDEQLVAERTVPLAHSHALRVRISQHTVEDFWRVDITNPAIPSRAMSTTVAPGDSFMMNLINGAVSGEPIAWSHLAHWGRDNLSG